MKTSEPTPLGRRAFLRGAGAMIALPTLESLRAPLLSAQTVPALAADLANAPVKRLVCVGTYLGFHTRSLNPRQAGSDYQMSKVLDPMEPHREDFSIFSGLDHRAPNGHNNWPNLLKGKGTPGISVDQIVAEKIGPATRMESLQVTCGASASGNQQMSYTRQGIPLPAVGKPSVLFRKLFTSASDRARTEYILESGGSVLDAVLADASSMKGKLNHADREKLGEYLDSVRDVEKKVAKQRTWLDRPSETPDYVLPEYDPIAPDLSLECETIIYDLMALALQADTTRVISFLVPGAGQVFSLDGKKLSAGYHGLSHHGNDRAKIAEFNRIGRAHVSRFAAFVDKLKQFKDAKGAPLLDSTAVFLGSGMGDANTHNNSNLPAILAGGSFKHGQHHAINRKAPDAPLLGDLFLSVMGQMGVHEERFVKATRNLDDRLF